MEETCFRTNSPAVIYEQFDDELVAIHLDTGAYHSLVGAAADAFLLLTQEATPSELAEALSKKYDAGPDQIREGLGGFIEQLQVEKLVTSVEKPQRKTPLTLDDGHTGLPFVPPNVAAYHDLNSLFLLDPIHEVGEQGWPHQADDPPA